MVAPKRTSMQRQKGVSDIARGVLNVVSITAVAVTLMRTPWCGYNDSCGTPIVEPPNESLVASMMRSNASLFRDELADISRNPSITPDPTSSFDGKVGEQDHNVPTSKVFEGTHDHGNSGEADINQESESVNFNPQDADSSRNVVASQEVASDQADTIDQITTLSLDGKERLRIQDEKMTDDADSNIMRSIIVVNETEFSNDYSSETSFNFTYFDNSPQCTALSPDEVSFTFITQASWDRLWIMKHHCQRWPAPHPMSIAVYLPPDSTHDEYDIARELDENLQCDLSRMTVTVMKGISPMDKYPVNILRNLAVQASKTSHIVYIDSDFLISDGLYDSLMSMAPRVASDPKVALVVPAFEYTSGCEEGFASDNEESLACLAEEWKKYVPKTKDDLLKLLKRSNRKKPSIQEGFHGVRFHGTTKYPQWMNQSDALQIPCMKNDRYEPYLAVRVCKDLPEFPRLFRGYGWNKLMWCQTLIRKLAYTLWQVPSGFVFHLPHEPSPSRATFKNEEGRVIRTPLYEKYMEWHKKIPDHMDRVPDCKKSRKKV